MAATNRTLQQGLRLHQAGKLGPARALYCQVLEKEPGHADAWYLLGMIAYQANDAPLAIKLIGRALQLVPTNAEYHNHLAAAQRTAGDLSGALTSLRRTLELNPDHVDATNTMGVVLSEQKNPTAAVPYFEKVLCLQPAHVLAISNLGNALHLLGRTEEAIEYYRRALEVQPESAEAHNNLGQVLQQLGRLDEAVVAFRAALRCRPDQVESLVNLGAALQKLGDTHDALGLLRRALELRPGEAAALNNLGNVLRDLQHFDEAEACYQQALRLRPTYALACNNMGTMLQIQGKFADSLPWYRKALALDPTFTDSYSNLLFALNYDPATDPDQLFAEHRAYGRMLERCTSAGHANDPNPQRRLRVGYTSADFRDHALVRFFAPILANHDSAAVEVTCYAEVARPDFMTAQFRAHAQRWRFTCGISDHRLAEQIRADGIDILVDLSGHTAGQRLRAFTYRPAPVQATYLGYPNTTGLSCIDYLLTDDVFFPPGEPARSTETPVRLARGVCAFQPPIHAPAVGPLPAATNALITFGSLHNLTKLNDRVLDLWCRLLHAFPASRLLIFRDSLVGAARDRLRQRFAERGLDGDRLELRHGAATAGYLAVYNEIDIALDVFPWGGGTTTYEALWMGVPVLTLRGPRPAERGTASALKRVGLSVWITDTWDDFVARGIALAHDEARLAQVRAAIRPTMAATVCDGVAFTRCLEGAYRSMWAAWCARQASQLSA